MKNKKIWAAIVFIFIITVVISGGYTAINKQSNMNLKEISIHANHLIYNNAQELINDVDLILIGEPINDIIEDEAVITSYNDKYVPSRELIESFHTLRAVKISKVLKGSFSDKTIKIAEVAAVVDRAEGKRLIIPSDYSIAQKGKKYIFFLKKGYTGDYFIMAVNQGKFNINGTDEKEKSKEAEESQFSDLKKDVLKHFAKEIKEAE